MKKADSEIPGSAFSFLLCYLPFLFFFPYHAPYPVPVLASRLCRTGIGIGRDRLHPPFFSVFPASNRCGITIF